MNESKAKTSKGVIISLVILTILVVSLSGIIVYDKIDNKKEEIEEKETKKINTTTNNNLKEENTKEIDDDSNLLEEVTEVYKNAYKVINSHEAYTTYNEQELSPYFTKKALATIERNVASASSTPAFFSGIFGHVNQSIRTLTIVEEDDDTVIATGQNINNQNGDSDNYPLYIIFKKESNSWKIDLFE